MTRHSAAHESASHGQGCARCGECCRRGGPALHRNDLELVTSGIVRTRDLFTLRTGEPARDNVRGMVAPAAGEIVKLKGRNPLAGDWTCIFFDPDQGCSIYSRRPVECRALDCRNPAELEAMYEQDRIGRRDILPQASSLLRLLDAHDVRCAHGRLAELSTRLEAGSGPAEANNAERVLSDMLAMLKYDADLRGLLVSRGIDPAELDFAFGRPLAETVRAYGLRVDKDNDGFTLRPDRDIKTTAHQGNTL